MAGATHEGTAGSPGDGPYMILQFDVAESGEVNGAAWQTYGCPSAVASGSMICELATGRSVEVILKLEAADLMRLLGGLPEGKERCADLAITALRKALGEER